MRKKELQLLEEYRSLVGRMYEYIDNFFVSKDQAFKRDYIIRTKGTGKMKDKKLIEDFKKEFPDYNDIQNYEFKKLNDYYDKLKLYEKKQIVIDVYGTKA